MPVLKHGMELIQLPDGIGHPNLTRRLPLTKKFIDHTGRTDGITTVIGLAGYIGNYPAWLIRCVCGEYTIRRSNVLFRGLYCGKCVEGIPKGPEYEVWKDLVTTQHTWKDFAEFMESMGHMGTAECLVRTTCGPYGPDNGRWGSHAEKQYWDRMVRIQQRDSLLIEVNGESLTLREWSKKIGISIQRIYQRVDLCEQLGGDLTEVVTTPPGQSMPCVLTKIANRLNEAVKHQKEPGVSKSPKQYKYLGRQAWAVVHLTDDFFDGEVHVISKPTISILEVADIYRVEAAKRGLAGRTASLGDTILVRATNL